MGKESEKVYVCVCVCVTESLCRTSETTQDCKPTTLQLEKIKVN